MPKSLLIPLLLALCWAIGLAPDADAAPPEKAQPILTVDQVKVGMKGYGMTVFHGTKIEPFNVEVVSINWNETPKRSVIWVRCTDERMMHTGPVQGMSGSPIYLWAEGEEPVPGKGGKLIGAFAFGYANTNECMAGIQPIEYMRAVGGRATAVDRPKLSLAAPPGAGLTLMSQLNVAAEDNAVSELTRARLGVMRDLYQKITPGADNTLTQDWLKPNTPADSGQAQRMMMPMAVGSSGVAQALGPVLGPMGIQPFAIDPSALGGKPPKGFEVDGVELEPGSALVVPFAWGDADLSGAGTVTDVLPDGTVLGFGHAMDGVGVTAIPMASGYVHFIVSLNTISYKRSGTLELKGALVQDEQAAVAGTAEKPYTSAPVSVTVNIEGQPKYEYSYEVVNHPTLTAPIAAAVVGQSTSSVQGPPTRNTVRYNMTAKFSGGHEISMQSAQIGTGGQGAAVAMAQLVGAVTQNPFEEITLESIDTTIDIDYGLDAYEIFSAKLNKTTAAPGETVTATVELMGLHEKMISRSFEITIPKDMPDGEASMILADASTYTQLMQVAKPHLMQIDSTEDLIKAVTEINSAEPTAVYAMLQTKRPAVALDGVELQGLPGSKAAVLAGNNPRAQVFPAFEITQSPMGRIVLGNAQLKLNIKRQFGSR